MELQISGFSSVVLHQAVTVHNTQVCEPRSICAIIINKIELFIQGD
jgi:hypothetical protein